MRNRRNGLSIAAVIVWMLAAAIVSGAAVYFWQNPGYFAWSKITGTEGSQTTDNGSQISGSGSQTLREAVQSRADAVLHTLKENNIAKLAEYVHPDKGLRFSPYSNVTDKDVTIPAGQLTTASKDSTKRTWGTYDGSGKPIDLTFGEYISKFVYPKDYLEAPEIIFNRAMQRGNTQNNVKEAFPDATSIEYYFPGSDSQSGGMGWHSLTLVFEQKDDSVWYLVGLVNNQWTI